MMRKIFYIISFLSIVLTVNANVYPYPIAIKESISKIYEVEIVSNEKTIPVDVITDYARWQTNNTKANSWASFAFEGEVKIRVRAKLNNVDFAQILPRNANVKVEIVNANTVEFTINKAGQYSLEFQQGQFIDYPLFIFADALPLKIPTQNNVIYFEKGLHEIGNNYELKSGQTVYLAPGAYVKGIFTANNAKDITITGQGILSGEDYAARSENHLITMRNCENVLIEGITIINAPRFCVSLTGDNQTCRNLKMMGWWFSTDGIGIGTNSLIEDCFFKVNDDAIKVYRSNTVARNCVIWQMENGAPFQIGWNMTGVNSNFKISNIDIIRVEHQWDNPNEAVVVAIHGGEGVMQNYLFEDIRIDNCDFRLFHLMTKPNRFGKWNPEKGSLRNFIFKDIVCYTQPKMKNIIKGHDKKHPVENVVFDKLVIAGKKVLNAEDGNFFIDKNTCSNIIFK
jgi:hypothetical protein